MESIKVRKIITTREWTGFDYKCTDYEDEIVDICEDNLKDPNMDWSWWEPTGIDVAVSVKYFPADADIDDIDSGDVSPLASWSCWESMMPHYQDALTMDFIQVINSSGVAIYYDSAVQFMDDDLREELHRKLAPCSSQEFFTAYEEAHEARFGEEWFLSDSNPVY